VFAAKAKLDTQAIVTTAQNNFVGGSEIIERLS